MSKNILVIDDEELIIKSLLKLLEKQGHTVLVARKGTEAIALSEKEAIDLIVADIRMPGINGVETIETIFANCQKRHCVSPPVIFITGYADEDIYAKAEALKPVAYIYKPFDITELVNKINEVL